MLSNKKIREILDMFNDQCIIIDVSTCRETTVNRIHNTLLEYTQFDTSITIEKVKQDGKCILIKDTSPSSININVYRRQSSHHCHLLDGYSVQDFLQVYLTNYDDW